MEWLNYHHLYYFWTVIKEGGVTKASRRLRVSQPTVSFQIRALAESLGEELFQRRGRTLELTKTGRVVASYADEIFALGRELQDTLKGSPVGRVRPFTIGVADVFPKWVTYRLLRPLARLQNEAYLVCREGSSERLLADLSIHGLDMILADAPLSENSSVKAYNHLLGECGVSLFATAVLARRYSPGFPRSLHGAPFVLPTRDTILRRALDHWFESHAIVPRIVGEFQDSAMLKAFGAKGFGLFFAPNVTERDIIKHYGVKRVGRIDSVRERFYAISVEKKIKHPATVAIIEHARTTLFA